MRRWAEAELDLSGAMWTQPGSRDALGEAEIAVIEPGLQEAFAKQIRETISVTREIRDGLMKRKAKDKERD